jgi:hypothetical protein
MSALLVGLMALGACALVWTQAIERRRLRRLELAHASARREPQLPRVPRGLS